MENLVIVAVGNPGREYEKTRHNVAWQVVERSRHLRSLNLQKKFKGEFAQVTIGDKKVFLLMPHTFMNLSGESLRPLVDFYKIKPVEVIVVHDELDFDFGRIAFKFGGGLAGHNGLKSISKNLGTNSFYRLRVGIGRPPHPNVSAWVLSRFDRPDSELYLDKVAEALDDFIESDYKKVSLKYNKNRLIQE